MTKTKHTSKRHIGSILKGGKSTSQWLWQKRSAAIAIVAGLLLYITHGDAVRTAARRQQVLQDSLANIKTAAMATTTELLRITSLPEIKKEIKRREINLQEPTRPPIMLKKAEDK